MREILKRITMDLASSTRMLERCSEEADRSDPLFTAIIAGYWESVDEGERELGMIDPYQAELENIRAEGNNENTPAIPCKPTAEPLARSRIGREGRIRKRERRSLEPDQLFEFKFFALYVCSLLFLLGVAIGVAVGVIIS